MMIESIHDHEVDSFNRDHVKIDRIIGIGDPCNDGQEYKIQLQSIDGEVSKILRFQSGPVLENGVNGITTESILAIAVDRLRCFQRSGKYACRENAIALTKIQEALMWLGQRSLDRQRRGVEGTRNL